MKNLTNKEKKGLTNAVRKMLFEDEDDFYAQDDNLHIKVSINNDVIKVKAWCPIDRYVCETDEAIECEVNEYIRAL